MNPIVEFKSEHNNTIQFMLDGVNVSLANAIRRTILSDIPLVVFKTAPYEENKSNIIVNTSRLNNEIIKQRLSCIPIHISDFGDFPIEKYMLEVNVENITNNVLVVTTEHFEIISLDTGKKISEAKTREIFPPNLHTGYFIDFVRLRPRISDELPGEKIHLTCEFSIGTAKEDGMFNVVSTCSYGFTPDLDKIQVELAKKRTDWKNDGMKPDDIEFESKNWELLDALRITKKDCFDFIVETIGIYTNHELLDFACDILIEKLKKLDTLIETNELVIRKSQSTMANSFDVILVNDDYTIGKIVEYMLYSKFYEGIQTLTYCGFKKMHPHDNDSIIRVAYKEISDSSIIKQNLKECVIEAIQVYNKIKKEFSKLSASSSSSSHANPRKK
jgi:DNA-directed RNA polymerase alpha subunit